jgi:hypothetical protein
MKSSNILAGVALALLNVALSTVAVGQDKATLRRPYLNIPTTAISLQ